MAHLKRSIVEVRAEEYCLAHAIVIAIAKLTNDTNYKAYIQGRKIFPAVQNLLETTGINLDNGGAIRELIRFYGHFKWYRIVVYKGLNCAQILFDGQVESPKRLRLLFDDVTRHYHVRNYLTEAMAKCTFAKRVIRIASEATHTYVIIRVVIACQVHHAYRQGFETPAAIATDISGVRPVTIIISQADDKRRSLFVS
jgi:hypothetical protein